MMQLVGEGPRSLGYDLREIEFLKIRCCSLIFEILSVDFVIYYETKDHERRSQGTPIPHR
jgi:hypothetical protein